MDPEGINSTYYVLFIGTVGMLLLGCASLFFFMSYYKRNIRAKEELHEQETNHQQQLIHSNLQTLEDERKRFAEDLHDEIGASLSAIRLHISRLENDLQQGPEQAQLREVKAIIDHSMASTRRISHNMLPPGLEMLGLVHVIEDLGKHISHSDTLKITTAGDPRLPRLHYNTELALYRILQELLNNTIKHAGASEVEIRLKADQQTYTLSYQDNGKGFDTESVKYSGLGLSNIESRTRMVNGRLDYRTAPGKGLYVEVQIPFTNKAHEKDPYSTGR